MFKEKLVILKEKKLLRKIIDRSSHQGPRIKINEKEYLNFSSNDYLGLSNHPYVIQKVQIALNKYGFGSGASRLLSGGTLLHTTLENMIAQFKNTESALIFNSGYSANLGILPSIADENTVIFSDEFNHASIIDGCRLSKCNVYRYRHKNVSHLEELLQKEKTKRKLVITDTVFSMDGDIAPLKDIFYLCKKYESILYIDDAHGTGVLGGGRGALTHFNLTPEPWIIQMGTFSKAIGSFGAFVASNSDIINWILNSARSFMFSTALPACVVAASIAALELIENNSDLLKKLWINREILAKKLIQLGYDIMGSETPIIPIKIGTVEDTIRISNQLLEKGIYAPAIRPPTVQTPRIRINVTAVHTDEDIEKLVEALKEVSL